MHMTTCDKGMLSVHFRDLSFHMHHLLLKYLPLFVCNAHSKEQRDAREKGKEHYDSKTPSNSMLRPRLGDFLSNQPTKNRTQCITEQIIA